MDHFGVERGGLVVVIVFAAALRRRVLLWAIIWLLNADAQII
jgi:hypothetical protein